MEQDGQEERGKKPEENRFKSTEADAAKGFEIFKNHSCDAVISQSAERQKRPVIPVQLLVMVLQLKINKDQVSKVRHVNRPITAWIRRDIKNSLRATVNL